MVELGQEWREFSDDGGDSNRRRTGAPMTYTQYDQGLGTEIGQKADLYRLKEKEKSKFFRLRKWQYRISTAINIIKKLIVINTRIIVHPLALVSELSFINRFRLSVIMYKDLIYQKKGTALGLHISPTNILTNDGQCE